MTREGVTQLMAGFLKITIFGVLAIWGVLAFLVM